MISKLLDDYGLLTVQKDIIYLKQRNWYPFCHLTESQQRLLEYIEIQDLIELNPMGDWIPAKMYEPLYPGGVYRIKTDFKTSTLSTDKTVEKPELYFGDRTIMNSTSYYRWIDGSLILLKDLSDVAFTNNYIFLGFDKEIDTGNIDKRDQHSTFWNDTYGFTAYPVAVFAKKKGEE